MCLRNMAAGLEDGDRKTNHEKKTSDNEDQLKKLKEYKERLQAELIHIDGKLMTSDSAGKGGE